MSMTKRRIKQAYMKAEMGLSEAVELLVLYQGMDLGAAYSFLFFNSYVVESN